MKSASPNLAKCSDKENICSLEGNADRKCPATLRPDKSGVNDTFWWCGPRQENSTEKTRQTPRLGSCVKVAGETTQPFWIHSLTGAPVFYVSFFLRFFSVLPVGQNSLGFLQTWKMSLSHPTNYGIQPCFSHCNVLTLPKKSTGTHVNSACRFCQTWLRITVRPNHKVDSNNRQ